MKILPQIIDQIGPGIDLSNQPDGVSIDMSDPVRDFEYARNAVTMTFDLFGCENVRLAFQALEYGDEPHAPPPGPFGDDVNFDGVAISGDGVDWYEIQDLRHLRSDRYTFFDIDLDAAVAAVGLTYGTAFRIRFCQYDNNPAPMDGFSIRGIEVTGDQDASLVLHLAMNDNAANPTVADSSPGGHDQTLVDPGGDPNTNAHSVPGVVGTALTVSKDGYIDCGNVVDAAFAENHDFAVAFWWKSVQEGVTYDSAVSTMTADSSVGVLWFTHDGNMRCWVDHVGVFTHHWSWAGGDDGVWHHYVAQRSGARIEIWRDATLAMSDDGAANTASLVGEGLSIGRSASGKLAAGTVDDFRVYDRALTEAEILAIAAAS